MKNDTRIVKVGGANLDDPRFLDELLLHIRQLRQHGRVVLVHGGGKQISTLQQALGIPERKHEGLRMTSNAGMKVVAMVLSGLMNKRVVAHFVHAGLDALGVSGTDRGMLRAPFWGRGELGRVGDTPAVDLDVLEQLLSQAPVLVVAPVCLGPDGGLLNVNADTVAQALAVALGATVLEFVTDVEAVRSDNGPASKLSPPEVQHLIRSEQVKGGMRPKMEAALAAVAAGVSVVRVGSLASLSSGACTQVHP